MYKLLWLFAIVNACTAPKNIKFRSENLVETKRENKLPPKKLSFLLKKATKIKVYAHTIESGDFATMLYISKIHGKKVEIIISEKSLNIRSKYRYFKQVGLPVTLANTKGEEYLMLNDKYVIKDVTQFFIFNFDPVVNVFRVTNELLSWNLCIKNPKNCNSLSPLEKYVEKEHIPSNLPQKTKSQIYKEKY